jgi:hypothetical protein
MRGQVEATGPEIALTIGTRMALGVGLGLLLASCFPEDRRSVGGSLLLAGAFGAAVLASELFGRPDRCTSRSGRNPVGAGCRPESTTACAGRPPGWGTEESPTRKGVMDNPRCRMSFA